MSKREDTITPTVSRILPDGRILELVYEPESGDTALALAHTDGSVSLTQELMLPSGERLTPYSGKNNLIATGCVLLPSAPQEYSSKAELLAEIQAYLYRYIDLSPGFEAIAAHYALLSWVYDAFNELPYLRFRGDYGTGKTRALLALGSICYKPFFASGASTVSPIFHVLDAFRGTLVLDEADFRFTDATAALTKILNNGNMAGLPVLRTMTNRHKELDPKAFRVFGPKLVGMRESFSDAALESRFLTEETGLRALRPEVPIHLPPSLAGDALALRNKLLLWRFRERAQVATDPTRAAAGVEPRFNQTALSLLSIVDDEGTLAAICERLKREDERVHLDRAASLEATMVQTVLQLVDSTERVTVNAIAGAFNQAAQDQLSRPVSARWTGWFLRTRLKLTPTKSQGVFVLDPAERPTLVALAQRYGVAEAQAA